MINDDHPLLLDNLKAQTSPEPYLESSIRVMEGFGTNGSKSRPFDYNEAVRLFNSWIYAAINLNATAVASTDLRLFVRRKPEGMLKAFRSRPCEASDPRMAKYLRGQLTGALGDIRPAPSTRRKIINFGDDFEEVTERHPILDLIRMVNPWFNGFDLLQLLVIYLEATGNAYWHPVIDPALGVPLEIWPMPSQWVQVVPDRETFVSGYVYGQSVREQREFAADEVIHFRTANPSNDGLYYGKGKIEAGWWSVVQNQSTHEMDLAFSDNQARPDYLAIVKSGAGQDVVDRFEENVKRQLRGRQKSGRFLTITGDVNLVPLNWSPKDMVGRDEVVEEIAAVFGVPVTLMKANDPNLASAQVGYASWKSNTILPLLHLIEQKLNERLLPLFGIEDDAVLAFDNPVPADRDFDLRESQARTAGGLRTFNEDRKLSGDPPLEGGDVLRVNGQSLDKLDADPPGFEIPAMRLGLGDGPAAIATDKPISGLDADKLAEKITQAVAKAMREHRESEEGWQSFDGFSADEGKTESQNTAGGDCRGCDNPQGSGRGGDQDNGEAASGSDSDDRNQRKGEDGQAPDADIGKEVRAKVERQDGESVRECVDRGIPILVEEGMGEEQATATAISMCGGEVLSHSGLMQGLEKHAHSHTKQEETGDADDTVREGEPERPQDEMIRELNRIFRKQREEVVRIMADPDPEAGLPKGAKAPLVMGSDYANLIDEMIEKMNGELIAAIAPPIERMISDGGEAGIRDLGLSAEIGFDVLNPEVIKFLEDYAIKLAGELSRTTMRAVRRSIAEGLTEGMSTGEISARIMETGVFEPARSEAIARTETARTFVRGTEIGWEQTGVVAGKQWLLAPDACQFCDAAAKQFASVPTGLNEPFYNEGSQLRGSDGGVMRLDYSDVYGAPLHPNCRCSVRAVLKDN